MIERAEIVEGGSDDGTVAAGSVVSIRYEGDDEVETYLLGSIEEKRDGIEIMSPGSPIGQALVGAQAGDVVEAETPGGDPARRDRLGGARSHHRPAAPAWWARRAARAGDHLPPRPAQSGPGPTPPPSSSSTGGRRPPT